MHPTTPLQCGGWAALQELRPRCSAGLWEAVGVGRRALETQRPHTSPQAPLACTGHPPTQVSVFSFVKSQKRVESIISESLSNSQYSWMCWYKAM